MCYQDLASVRYEGYSAQSEDEKLKDVVHLGQIPGGVNPAAAPSPPAASTAAARWRP